MGKKTVEEEARSAMRLALALQVVGTVALVGILVNNRRSLKFSKGIVKDYNEFNQMCAEAISYYRSTGREISYYPGIGVYVDAVRSRVPALN